MNKAQRKRKDRQRKFHQSQSKSYGWTIFDEIQMTQSDLTHSIYRLQFELGEVMEECYRTPRVWV